MTFRDILPIDPEIMDAMRKYEKTKSIMVIADYLDEEQRKREDFTEEELMYLEFRREYIKKELTDENVLSKLEESIYEEKTVGDKLSKFEKDNEKVFVKSLYRM